MVMIYSPGEPDFEIALPIQSGGERPQYQQLLELLANSSCLSFFDSSRQVFPFYPTLPRELRDVVLHYVMDSLQPELEYGELILLSDFFVTSSARL